MTKVKFCGITDASDALEAVRLGVDMVGFVCYKGSRRYVDAKKAAAITALLPERVTKVGVFVNEETATVKATAAAAGFDAVQLHGDEDPAYCGELRSQFRVIKAVRIGREGALASASDFDVDLILFDTFRHESFGGTGAAFDWSVVADARPPRPFLVSGGLTDSNVAEAIKVLRPFGVDVSGGIESTPGRKDWKKMKRFIEEVRRCGQ